MKVLFIFTAIGTVSATV